MQAINKRNVPTPTVDYYQHSNVVTQSRAAAYRGGRRRDACEVTWRNQPRRSTIFVRQNSWTLI